MNPKTVKGINISIEMENKERKTEDDFQVSDFGKLKNGGAIIKNKK